MATALEKIREQRNFMQTVFEKQKLLKGEDVATLLESTVELVEKHKLFERDIITGRIRSLPLANSKDKILDQATAKNIFKTFFCDKLYIHRVTDTGSTFKAISAEQQDVIFQRTLELCTYNSRAELYKSIPKWDGTPRIQTFLRDYFKCDANWHFFLLFLTYVVGVMDNPETTIIEHWFDFVGESKGTGKTTFFKHLLSGVGCEANAFECSADKRNLDDFWAELYARNTIIAIDDECKMLEKISYDTWKAVVTARYDTFSQKFCPPETHARPFVFVRTSNHPKTVYSLNERRQIIFNIGLREQECLHWDLDKNYMAQLLAEAKDYYVKHNGIYKLTQAEREEILEQNLDNTSTETPEYNLVEKYIEYLTENSSEYMENLVSVPDENYNWTSWNKFVDWAKEQKHNIGTMKFGAVFWKNLEVYARKHKGLIWLKNDMRKRKITKSTVRVFGIAKSPEQVDTEELPDLPF